MGTTVLLVDNHRMMREGLRVILEQAPGLRVVADASDGRSAIELSTQHRPDVVVMDVTMPGLNGIEATRQILQALPSVKVIALSMHSDKRYVIQMLKAGAVGYLLKDGASDELVRAIHTVLADERFLGQGVAGTLVEHVVRESDAGAGSAYSDLTAREREVLQLLAEGRTSKQIASTLHVAVKTVDIYRRDIMRKLDLHSVAELTRYALREGLSSLED